MNKSYILLAVLFLFQAHSSFGMMKLFGLETRREKEEREQKEQINLKKKDLDRQNRQEFLNQARFELKEAIETGEITSYRTGIDWLTSHRHYAKSMSQLYNDASYHDTDQTFYDTILKETFSQKLYDSESFDTLTEALDWLSIRTQDVPTLSEKVKNLVKGCRICPAYKRIIRHRAYKRFISSLAEANGNYNEALDENVLLYKTISNHLDRLLKNELRQTNIFSRLIGCIGSSNCTKDSVEVWQEMFL